MLRRAQRCNTPEGSIHAVIWTTTPWTLPSTQALNVHREFDYALVETSRGHLLLAASLVEQALSRYRLDGKIVGTAKGAALERIVFRHPFYDRASPVYLGEYVNTNSPSNPTSSTSDTVASKSASVSPG